MGLYPFKKCIYCYLSDVLRMGNIVARLQSTVFIKTFTISKEGEGVTGSLVADCNKEE